MHLFIGSKYIEYKLKYKNINLAQFYGAHNAHVVKDHTLCASAGNHELEQFSGWMGPGLGALFRSRWEKFTQRCQHSLATKCFRKHPSPNRDFTLTTSQKFNFLIFLWRKTASKIKEGKMPDPELQRQAARWPASLWILIFQETHRSYTSCI